MPCGTAKRVKKKRKTAAPNPPFVQTVCSSSRRLFFYAFSLSSDSRKILLPYRQYSSWCVFVFIQCIQPHQPSPPPPPPRPQPPCVLTFRIPLPPALPEVPGLFLSPRYFTAFEATFLNTPRWACPAWTSAPNTRLLLENWLLRNFEVR